MENLIFLTALIEMSIKFVLATIFSCWKSEEVVSPERDGISERFRRLTRGFQTCMAAPLNALFLSDISFAAQSRVTTFQSHVETRLNGIQSWRWSLLSFRKHWGISSLAWPSVYFRFTVTIFDKRYVWTSASFGTWSIVLSRFEDSKHGPN
jgi:hypothetical protein